MSADLERLLCFRCAPVLTYTTYAPHPVLAQTTQDTRA